MMNYKNNIYKEYSDMNKEELIEIIEARDEEIAQLNQCISDLEVEKYRRDAEDSIKESNELLKEQFPHIKIWPGE